MFSDALSERFTPIEALGQPFAVPIRQGRFMTEWAASPWTRFVAKHLPAKTLLSGREQHVPSKPHAGLPSHGFRKLRTSVRSSGRWKVSLISSGDFPSIILAKALEVNSTSCFSSRLSAADVSSQRRFVSSLMNFSSNSLRSCP